MSPALILFCFANQLFSGMEAMWSKEFPTLWRSLGLLPAEFVEFPKRNRDVLGSMIDFSAPFRSLLGSLPSSFHAFVLPFLPPAMHLFVPPSFHRCFPLSLVPFRIRMPVFIFHSALLLCFIFSSICSFIAWRLQSWPGGLREAIK